MADRLLDYLSGLEPRERGLLALLCCVVLPLALVFGLLLPLQQARQAAEVARDDMRDLSHWVSARSREAVPGQTVVAAVAAEPIGAAGIERSLTTAQLRAALSDLAVASGGRVALRFEAVPYGRLMRWLDGVHPGWGYDLTRLELSATETPGLVRAELALQAP